MAVLRNRKTIDTPPARAGLSKPPHDIVAGYPTPLPPTPPIFKPRLFKRITRDMRLRQLALTAAALLLSGPALAQADGLKTAARRLSRSAPSIRQKAITRIIALRTRSSTAIIAGVAAATSGSRSYGARRPIPASRIIDSSQPTKVQAARRSVSGFAARNPAIVRG